MKLGVCSALFILTSLSSAVSVDAHQKIGVAHADTVRVSKNAYQGFVYPNNAQNAVSLSFDDARVSQVDIGLPILDKYGVKATFYVVPNAVEERLAGWQQAAKNGHEIANHTANHVCSGNFEWLRQKGLGLEQIDLNWLAEDMDITSRYIEEKLAVKATGFAYPCGHTFVGQGEKTQSYVPLVAEKFNVGRTWNDETGNNPNYVDMAQVAAIRMDGMSFEQLVEMIEFMRVNNSWIVLAGHEVGKSGWYTVDEQVLVQLIAYFNDPKNGYWLDTIDNVATHITKQRAHNSEKRDSSQLSSGD